MTTQNEIFVAKGQRNKSKPFRRPRQVVNPDGTRTYNRHDVQLVQMYRVDKGGKISNFRDVYLDTTGSFGQRNIHPIGVSIAKSCKEAKGHKNPKPGHHYYGFRRVRGPVKTHINENVYKKPLGRLIRLHVLANIRGESINVDGKVAMLCEKLIKDCGWTPKRLSEYCQAVKTTFLGEITAGNIIV